MNFTKVKAALDEIERQGGSASDRLKKVLNLEKSLGSPPSDVRDLFKSKIKILKEAGAGRPYTDRN